MSENEYCTECWNCIRLRRKRTLQILRRMRQGYLQRLSYMRRLPADERRHLSILRRLSDLSLRRGRSFGGMICARPAVQLLPAVWKSFARDVCPPATNVNPTTNSASTAKGASTVFRTASSAWNAAGVRTAGRMHTVRNVTAAHMNTTIPANCAIIAPKKDDRLCASCASCGFCSDWEPSDICTNCDACPEEYDRLCEEGEHCNLCWEWICENCNQCSYDGNILCSDCGDCCSSCENFCDECEKCEECCRNTSEENGCYHDICVESSDWDADESHAVNPAKTALKKMRCATTAAFAQIAAL